MSQSKNAYLSFFSAALLATGFIHGLNPRRIDAASFEATENNAINESQTANILAQVNLTRYKTEQAEVLSDNSIVDNAESDVLIDEDESKLEQRRLISLAFFLLFFVPLGIFYPLFLFYKMLLIKPDESKNVDGVNGILALDDPEPSTAEPVQLALPSEKKLDRATVSKLQIAFSPTASELRQKLSKVGFDTDVNIEYNLIDLMHQTVAILIEQNYWTHASYGSVTLSLAEVGPQFNFISQQERKKIADQQGGSKYKRNITNSKDYGRKYCYVVVTLILCTSNKTSLFKRIDTKKQLLEELVQLGKMPEQSLIKFELLWSPQHSDKYLSNDELLIEYSDMTRLL